MLPTLENLDSIALEAITSEFDNEENALMLEDGKLLNFDDAIENFNDEFLDTLKECNDAIVANNKFSTIGKEELTVLEEEIDLKDLDGIDMSFDPIVVHSSRDDFSKSSFDKTLFTLLSEPLPQSFPSDKILITASKDDTDKLSYAQPDEHYSNPALSIPDQQLSDSAINADLAEAGIGNEIESEDELEENGDAEQQLNISTYKDYSNMSDEEANLLFKPVSMRGRSQESFPVKLHLIIERCEQDGYASIISWQDHGRAFKIHSNALFLEKVMPKFFFQTKMSSFTRQLGMYGFHKIVGKENPDKGAFFHELFLRGRPGLCTAILRLKKRALLDPHNEPQLKNFKNMPHASDVEFILLGDSATDETTRPRIVHYTESPHPCDASTAEEKLQKTSRKGTAQKGKPKKKIVTAQTVMGASSVTATKARKPSKTVPMSLVVPIRKPQLQGPIRLVPPQPKHQLPQHHYLPIRKSKKRPEPIATLSVNGSLQFRAPKVINKNTGVRAPTVLTINTPRHHLPHQQKSIFVPTRRVRPLPPQQLRTMQRVVGRAVAPSTPTYFIKRGF